MLTTGWILLVALLIALTYIAGRHFGLNRPWWALARAHREIACLRAEIELLEKKVQVQQGWNGELLCQMWADQEEVTERMHDRECEAGRN